MFPVTLCQRSRKHLYHRQVVGKAKRWKGISPLQGKEETREVEEAALEVEEEEEGAEGERNRILSRTFDLLEV